MSISFKAKVLAGVAALAVGSSALANTNLNGSTTGDLFLNVVDTTNSTSFLFDTGISQASFNGNVSINALSFADANWTAFITGHTGDSLLFSVMSATKTTGAPAVGTVFFTGTSVPSAVNGNNISAVQGVVDGFATGANGIASSTTNSVLLDNSRYWGDPLREGSASTNLYSVDNALSAAPGTSLAFYSETSNALRSASTPATVATFAGLWSLDLAGATLSYTTPAVPLPAPLLLLLSGLGLMGIVSRRKGAAQVFSPMTAA
jgi:hypothetical protein